MAYRSLEECLMDLERHGQLVRVREEVDPFLEMASIHLRVHEAGGPALFFENLKGSRFRAASNLFGTLERSRFLFRDTLEQVSRLIRLKNDPLNALRRPLKNIPVATAALKAMPKKNSFQKPVLFQQVRISDIPQIQHWPLDGGAFVTLPQVYTEDIGKPGIRNSNLGMYRVQLSGNDYVQDKEIGLHYQLHRGIGVHQDMANRKGMSLKVSVFVGGPPAHSVAAVMPLPEGISEISFAGVLGGRRFRYVYEDGFCISTDADFVITGEVFPGGNKPEGPFGDHLGYYSLRHLFPVMRVHRVYARENAVWPFTVVGRPPQEDTGFGQLIREITGEALQLEIPGLKEVNAVDAAGVHPLLLAIGSERYTPYQPGSQPAEILTIANRILGTGQLSLAKFLFITATTPQDLANNNTPDTCDIPGFFQYLLQRIDLRRDIHFYTHTTIDTLDYSGTGLNSGSKVVLAAYGEKNRELSTAVPECLKNLQGFENARLVLPGIVALQANRFTNAETTVKEMNRLNEQCSNFIKELERVPLVVVCDDADFVSGSLRNFLWVTFTRSNPSHDIHGIASFTENKHWGCEGPVLIDARIKPHHAPILEKDPATEKKQTGSLQKGAACTGSPDRECMTVFV